MSSLRITNSLLILLFSFGLSCADDKDAFLKEKDLPDMARSFVEHYLPNHEIILIEDMKPQGEELDKYLVTFSDGLTIVFNKFGYWWRVESESQVPESLLAAIDSQELDALKAKYPRLKIKRIYNDFNVENNIYQDVPFYRRLVLTDDTEVFLYSHLGINNMIVGVNLKSNTDKIPSKIEYFLNEYYKNARIDLLLYAIENDGQEVYKVYFTPSESNSDTKTPSTPQLAKNKGLVVFDKEGEWQSIYHSAKKFPIAEKLLETLSNYAKDYLKSQYPDVVIYEIAKIEEHYQFRIEETKYILVDYEETPTFRLDIIQEFVRKHFNSEQFNQKISVRVNTHDRPKRYYVTIEIGNQQNHIIKIETFADGLWQTIETPNYFIPESVLKTLPGGIMDWINEKGVLNTVFKIIKNEDGGFSILTKQIMVSFDKDGKIIT